MLAHRAPIVGALNRHERLRQATNSSRRPRRMHNARWRLGARCRLQLPHGHQLDRIKRRRLNRCVGLPIVRSGYFGRDMKYHFLWLAGTMVWAVGCGSRTGLDDYTWSARSSAAGGASPLGGSHASGGLSLGIGGTGFLSSGGSTFAGGTHATGGALGSGGSTFAGGTHATGGALSSGGTRATGGTMSAGATKSIGGSTNTAWFPCKCAV